MSPFLPASSTYMLRVTPSFFDIVFLSLSSPWAPQPMMRPSRVPLRSEGEPCFQQLLALLFPDRPLFPRFGPFPASLFCSIAPVPFGSFQARSPCFSLLFPPPSVFCSLFFEGPLCLTLREGLFCGFDRPQFRLKPLSACRGGDTLPFLDLAVVTTKRSLCRLWPNFAFMFY